MFDPSNNSWPSNNITYGDIKMNLRSVTIVNHAVENFVKNLDIGEMHQLPGYCGVSRTVSALVTMIIDLNLKVRNVKENLIWFNDNHNHFIFEFSDDGAPETKELTMTTGSMTLWNIGNRVRSREFHYPLHLVSAKMLFLKTCGCSIQRK